MEVVEDHENVLENEIKMWNRSKTELWVKNKNRGSSCKNYMLQE